MHKTKPIQISIPQPCNEDWNKMAPQEKGRFCDSCQRCLVDFSELSDKELYQYLADNAGNKICGRFKASQLNRNILPPPQPLSTVSKWLMAAGMALVLTAIPNSPLFAEAPHAQEQILKCDAKPNPSGSKTQVYGAVYSYDGEPVKGATVIIFYGDKEKRTTTDKHGTFQFSGIESGYHTIEAFVKGKGVEIKRGLIKNIPIETNRSVYIDLTLSTGDNYFPYVKEYEDPMQYMLGMPMAPPDIPYEETNTTSHE
ncbi:MAG: carboxypeptidase regulatory-like domain-containing protein [Chitinophagales bacterium]|nr:carboxypeptidase regulatory-like domain-containing protein [Chitinophagaceae bacterium]MCB9064849.1 carboxypeptidase regulatory-like domain-containing protein [Chitinophagales bacterium]